MLCHQDPVPPEASRHLPVCVCKDSLSPTALSLRSVQPISWWCLCPSVNPPGLQGIRASELFTKTRPKIYMESGRLKHRGTTQGQVGTGVPEADRGRERPDPLGASARDAAWVPRELSRPSPAHLCIRLRGAEARVPRVRSLDPL